MDKPIPILDDLFYYVNYISYIFSYIRLATLRTKAKGLARFETVQYRIRRDNKSIGRREAIDHLHDHGVPTFFRLYDGKYGYFSVRVSQRKWVDYLLIKDKKGNVIGKRSAKQTWTQRKTGKVARAGKFGNWFFQ